MIFYNKLNKLEILVKLKKFLIYQKVHAYVPQKVLQEKEQEITQIILKK